jgi:hypothetical protein
MSYKIKRDLTDAQEAEIEKLVNAEEYYDRETFLKDAERWVSAVSSGRMICRLESISRPSGNRRFSFYACTYSKDCREYYYLNFVAFLGSLGIKVDKLGAVRAGLSGPFGINHRVVLRLRQLGLIGKNASSVVSRKYIPLI